MTDVERQFVHLQKVQLTASTTDASGNAGILAVSVASNANESLRWELSVDGCNTLFVKEHSLADIRKDIKLDLSTLVPSSNITHQTLLPSDIANFLQLWHKAATTDSEYQLSFQRTSSASEALSTVRAALKERMKSGMVRLLWSSDLVAAPAVSLPVSTHFTMELQLVQHTQKLMDQLQEARNQNAKLERDLDGWKETATALEGEWDQEKSKLVQNFCDLYTATQQRRDELATQQQDEMCRLQEDYTRLKEQSHKKQAARLPDFLHNVPDDMDRDQFDDDMVQRLASGQRVPLAAASSLSATAAATTSPPLHKKRRNPLTGATEYFDADAALADVLVANDLPPPKKARASRATASTAKAKGKITRTSRTESNEDDDSSEALPVLQKPKKLDAAAKKGTKKKAPKVDTDDDAGSDDDKYGDKELDAEIMADLLSLQRPS